MPEMEKAGDTRYLPCLARGGSSRLLAIHPRSRPRRVRSQERGSSVDCDQRRHALHGLMAVAYDRQRPDAPTSLHRRDGDGLVQQRSRGRRSSKERSLLRGLGSSAAA